MKIANTLIISIASILIVAICSGTILLLHEKPADTAKLTDKDKIEMLVTLNSHRLELFNTIMNSYNDNNYRSVCIRTYAEQIIKDAIFLEHAMTDIVMNDSLIKRNLEIKTNFERCVK